MEKILFILTLLLLSHSLLFGCMHVEEDDENTNSADEGSLVSVPSGDNNGNANVNELDLNKGSQSPTLPQ